MKSGAKMRIPMTGLVTAALTAAAGLAAGDAHAHGDVDVERTTGDRPGQPGGDLRAEHGEGEAEEREPRYMLGLDLVLGWGKVPFAVQNLPTTGTQAVTYSRSDQTETDVQSILLQGSAEVAEHIGVGFRLPLTFATFSPEGSAARSTTSFGNLELEGEYAASIGRGLKLVGALGIALPTAQGDEIPAGLSGQNASSASQSGYDRWSLSRAAAFARGYEDNALFEPHRLGLIPKVGLEYRFRRLTIEPYVKVENLIGTSTLLDASYVGELVAAVRVGYGLTRHVEVALKGWVNVGYAGTDDDKATAASLEPQVVLRFGPVRPYAGVILPLAGPPKDDGFVGVRLGLAASF